MEIGSIQLIEARTVESCYLNWTDSIPNEFPLIWKNQDILYPENLGDDANPLWTVQIPSGSTFNVGCTQTTLLSNFLSTQVPVSCSSSGTLSVS